MYERRYRRKIPDHSLMARHSSQIVLLVHGAVVLRSQAPDPGRYLVCSCIQYAHFHLRVSQETPSSPEIL